MSIELFESICRQSMQFRMPIHWLSFFGEPLMYPRFDDALRIFAKCGLGDGAISTNGLLLDDLRIDTLVRYGRMVRLAVDSAREDVYRVLRNNTKFDVLCANVKKLIERSAGTPLRIEIQYLKTRLNHDEGVEELRSLFGSHANVSYITKPCGVFTPESPDFTPTGESAIGFDVRTCSSPYAIFNVLYNGDCVLCCRDIDGEQVIGNVMEEDISRIWNGPRARTMREQLRKGSLDQLPLCRRCGEGRNESVEVEGSPKIGLEKGLSA